MLSNLQELYLYNTQINGTIPREISMLSNLQNGLHETISAQFLRMRCCNLQELAVQHAYRWHNSSRDIDAEQFADIGFVQHADQWHNSSRDIDAEQFAEIVFVQHADQWHNSSEISMLRNLQKLELD